MQNLKPFQDRTPEEVRAIGAKGGRATGKAKLRRKKGRELVRALLSLGVEDPSVRTALERAGFNPDEVNNEFAMHFRQIEKAQKVGSTEAYKAVLKAAGYDVDEGTGTGAAVQVIVGTPEAAEGLRHALATGAQPGDPDKEG